MRRCGAGKSAVAGAVLVAVAAVAGCGNSGGGGSPFADGGKDTGTPSASGKPQENPPSTKPSSGYLSEADLESALLEAADIGPGWVREPVTRGYPTGGGRNTGAVDDALRKYCPPYKEQADLNLPAPERYVSADYKAPRSADVAYLEYELSIRIQQRPKADLVQSVAFGRRSGRECTKMPVAEPGNPYTIDYSEIRNLPPGDEAAGVAMMSTNASGSNAKSWVLVRIGGTAIEIEGSPNAVQAFMGSAVAKLKETLATKH